MKSDRCSDLYFEESLNLSKQITPIVYYNLTSDSLFINYYKKFTTSLFFLNYVTKIHKKNMCH